ncbi:hypothetical protein K505DRAFT_362100 [Melanomma pulvis-pyrius CBS 109.77]|uniref:Uncharacterized protein n=1 Tax=Melanomma pulvis-pyrius CBS 109.77 TaxID=1314802 RepID=A0A6A6XB08_9PLEO|nr:hypothetical protein K505DRAFT_362100 [Melanomma pulvis-pyrius CBS 109.77]
MHADAAAPAAASTSSACRASGFPQRRKMTCMGSLIVTAAPDLDTGPSLAHLWPSLALFGPISPQPGQAPEPPQALSSSLRLARLGRVCTETATADRPSRAAPSSPPLRPAAAAD